MKIQITLMDEKDYILDYADFKGNSEGDFYATDRSFRSLESYVAAATTNPDVVKIHLRKWDE